MRTISPGLAAASTRETTTEALIFPAVPSQPRESTVHRTGT
jgi:hypothetical protein